MANEKLKNLSMGNFVKSVAARLGAVSKGSDAPVPELLSYPENRLAAELHPHVQFLTVREIVEHSPDMKSYLLAPDKKRGTEKLAWFSAGQYLCFNLKIGDARLSRPYSIASSPRDTLQGYYQITVKRVEGGLASGYILDNWAVGTAVTASAPLGEFTYEPLRDAKTVIGIAGGSGITPFRAFARAIAQGDEDFNLILLYGSRSKKDAVFAEEIAALAETCGKIKLVQVLSASKAKGCEQGFVTAKLIQKYAPENEPYSVFLCGPQAMYRFVDKELETLSLRQKFIRHELFGEYFHPDQNEDYPQDGRATYQITVHIAGETHKIACAADTSLLRAMEQAGLNPPSDCRSGRCGWCHSQLLQGDVYVPESVDGRRMADKIYGYIHPCCTFPLTDCEIDVPPLPMG